uniref:Uncharacterized protein LOC102806061 n=1 Tax=Saccoglossus kowalevskii TaxID=10224 RepID=A0ABM0MN11_SACKO|nr:PREDICTED: uncharacterized protein LOC102806061 [Saccoglossus kowalevskii]
MRGEVKTMRKQNDDKDNRDRRCNLIFRGIEQTNSSKDWDTTENIIKDLIRDKLGIVKEVIFERVHRLAGTPFSLAGRPIIARFSFFKDKEHVLRNAFNLKGSEISIDEDFSPRMRGIRSKLLAKRRQILACDSTAKVRLRFDKLFVNSELGKRVYIYDDELNVVKELISINQPQS